jgi:hypothetical protein
LTTKKKTKFYENEDRETTLKAGGEWTKRVNVDIPVWAIKELDKEADRRGITRQSLIKNWLVDKIDLLTTKSVS